MDTLSLGFADFCLALTGLVSAAEDKLPMPQTYRVKGMDPAEHIQDCESLEETRPVDLGPLQHETWRLAPSDFNVR